MKEEGDEQKVEVWVLAHNGQQEIFYEVHWAFTGKTNTPGVQNLKLPHVHVEQTAFPQAGRARVSLRYGCTI